jgi:hypothetical protein
MFVTEKLEGFSFQAQAQAKNGEFRYYATRLRYLGSLDLQMLFTWSVSSAPLFRLSRPPQTSARSRTAPSGRHRLPSGEIARPATGPSCPCSVAASLSDARFQSLRRQVTLHPCHQERFPQAVRNRRGGRPAQKPTPGGLGDGSGSHPNSRQLTPGPSNRLGNAGQPAGKWRAARRTLVDVTVHESSRQCSTLPPLEPPAARFPLFQSLART